MFPDEDYTLTVNVTPEDCDGVINSVKVDGAEIDWKAGALVHCGKKAVFELNQTLYILKSITINGVAKDLSSMYGDLTVKMTDMFSTVSGKHFGVSGFEPSRPRRSPPIR